METTATEGGPGAGLWRYRGIAGGKYLVLRRDGSMFGLNFVLGPRDAAASAGLRAYAAKAASLGYPEPYVLDVLRLCEEFDAELSAQGPSDPSAGPERVDDPVIAARLAAGPFDAPNRTPREELAAVNAAIELLEERKAAIYRASVEAPKEQKVGADGLAMMLSERRPRMTFPVQITGITAAGKLTGASFMGYQPGAWCSVKPCAEEYGDKTYLGVYLGNLATNVNATLNLVTGVLEVWMADHNPAIWVPDLKRIIFGNESWWAEIKSEGDLRQITTSDIEGTWYVQALRTLNEARAATEGAADAGLAAEAQPPLEPVSKPSGAL